MGDVLSQVRDQVDRPDLPDEWSWLPLGKIAVVATGGTPSRDAPQYWNGTIPWVKTGEVNYRTIRSTEECITEEGLNNSNAKLYPPGTLLIAMYGQGVTRGRAAVLGIEAAINQACAAITTADGIDSTFLFYAFIHQYESIRELGHGANQRNLNMAILRSIHFPVPPLKEQKSISGLLRKVEHARANAEKIVTAARQLKQSLVRHLFTYGPVPVEQADRVPLQETAVGPVPAHWKVVKLVELLREPLRNGHSAKATNTNQGIRTLTLTAVTQNDFSVENTKLTTADPERVRVMWLRAGDILVERANTPEYVGLAALYEGADDFAIYPDLMIRVRVNEDQVRPKYLAEFLLTGPCRTYYRSNAKATAGNFPKIDQGVIEATSVPIAPADEQRDIEVAIRAVDQKITREQARFNSLDAMFKTLLHTLMTGKVRVGPEAP